MSQATLARESSVSKSDVSRHERNADDSNPTVDVLYRLATALRVDVVCLLEPVGYRIPSPEEYGRERKAGSAGEHQDVAARVGELLSYIGTLEGEARSKFLLAVTALFTAIGDTGNPAATGTRPHNERR